MKATHASEIISGYLARLEAEAADLPRTERRELVDGVREHIEELRAQMPEESDAQLLNLLDRLGHPAELAEEERHRLGLGPVERPRIGLLEIGALVLTPLIWPIGVILLWTSSAWSVRDKLIGTLIPPGGLFTSLMVFSYATIGVRVEHCSGGSVNGHQIAATCTGPPTIVTIASGILLLLVVISPILAGIFMGVRLRRNTRALAASGSAFSG